VSTVDRWLLPEGIGDVLPEQARQLETLRRELLDLFSVWGYQLIIPPMLEFTESLLIGTNPDLDLQTFKVTDQISGRTMGLRADITPQAARIDAHSLKHEGPLRLCYAGSVLHSRPANALASRSPIQVGAECFGIAGLDADTEVISLLLETLTFIGIRQPLISLGHVGLFKALCQSSALDTEQEAELLDLLQRKAARELDDFISQNGFTNSAAKVFRSLIQLHGNYPAIINDARNALGNSGDFVEKCLVELETICNTIASRYPDCRIHIDLAELPGYHYHTGIVFAAFCEGQGAAIANGGRYDDVGQVFGRARPATGFNADLKTLIRAAKTSVPARQAILARFNENQAFWQTVSELRAKGEIVVCLTAAEKAPPEELDCDRELVEENGTWQVKPLSS
jgi:ATP phosphoribosyltransferase regulatory subunit